MSPTDSFDRNHAREQLGVSGWQLDLAIDAGLIRRSAGGRCNAVDVARWTRDRDTFERRLSEEQRLTVADAASRLGVAPKAFTRMVAEVGLEPVEAASKRAQTVLYRTADVDSLAGVAGRRSRVTAKFVSVDDLAAEYRVSTDEVVRAVRTVSAKLHRSPAGQQVAAQRAGDVRKVLDRARRADGERDVVRRHRDDRRRAPEMTEQARQVAERVHVWVRDRKDDPDVVHLHLGPTNSGKTYGSLQRLAARGAGVYAAPLRMLAREAYEKLAAQVGPDQVGLITGEEQVNADAPILCCTAEMAPLDGELLVVDEAHWAADRDRGYAWTRLLVGGTYERIEVAASRGARPFLEAVFENQPGLRVEEHERLSPLRFGGTVELAAVPAGSLLVAFTRKGVHALAKRLLSAGRTVAVLYGALPPEARTDQIRKFIDGEVEILVATDVVGHGLNTPAAAVVFAQTEKFDGEIHRELELWEAAQVAGRAGRYGLAGDGLVFALDGEPGFTPNVKLVARAADAAGGRQPDGLTVEKGLLRPTFRDLGEPDAHQLGVALTAWGAAAAHQLADRDSVEPLPVEPLIARWQEAAGFAGARLITTWAGLTSDWPIDGETAWRIVTTPVDAESPVFQAITEQIATGVDKLTELLDRAELSATADLDAAEKAAAIARDIMVTGRAFPDTAGHLHERATMIEARAAATISQRLARALATSTAGVCHQCGGHCAPHFTYCDPCHASRRQPRPERRAA